MICDAHTCRGCPFLERNERDDSATILAEFLTDCQQAKCKVVRLVRQQISKLQNMQYEVPITNERNEDYIRDEELPYGEEPYRPSEEEREKAEQTVEEDSAYLEYTTHPEKLVEVIITWILECIRQRAYMILAAAVLGVIAWTALVYGVFLGATACGSGRTCYSSSVRYAHAKRSLF